MNVLSRWCVSKKSCDVRLVQYDCVELSILLHEMEVFKHLLMYHYAM